MITRAFLMAEITRALGDRENAVAIITELERRLPTDGRRRATVFANENGYIAHWWDTQKTEMGTDRWVHTHDFRNGHLLNVIKLIGKRIAEMKVELGDTEAPLIRNSLEGWEQKRLELVREAYWRGLTDKDIPELAPEGTIIRAMDLGSGPDKTVGVVAEVHGDGTATIEIMQQGMVIPTEGAAPVSMNELGAQFHEAVAAAMDDSPMVVGSCPHGEPMRHHFFQPPEDGDKRYCVRPYGGRNHPEAYNGLCFGREECHSPELCQHCGRVRDEHAVGNGHYPGKRWLCEGGYGRVFTPRCPDSWHGSHTNLGWAATVPPCPTCGESYR